MDILLKNEEEVKPKLYCGNCADVLTEINIENAVIVTDPPFNIGYHYGMYKDKLPDAEYYKQLADILLKANRFVCIHYPEQLHKITASTGIFPTKIVSWVYNSNTRKQHRDIGFYNITPDFSKVRQPYKNINDKRIQRLIAKGSKGSRLYDWWNVNQVKNVGKEKTEHPCQMPLEVMKRIVGVLPDGVTVVDPFMGSGTTGVACKELGIRFIGIEVDPKYFEIAQRRVEKDD